MPERLQDQVQLACFLAVLFLETVIYQRMHPIAEILTENAIN